MSSKTLTHCDRCNGNHVSDGRPYPEKWGFLHVTINDYPHGLLTTEKFHYDLCPACQLGLRAWLKPSADLQLGESGSKAA